MDKLTIGPLHVERLNRLMILMANCKNISKTKKKNKKKTHRRRGLITLTLMMGNISKMMERIVKTNYKLYQAMETSSETALVISIKKIAKSRSIWITKPTPDLFIKIQPF